MCNRIYLTVNAMSDLPLSEHSFAHTFGDDVLVGLAIIRGCRAELDSLYHPCPRSFRVFWYCVTLHEVWYHFTKYLKHFLWLFTNILSSENSQYSQLLKFNMLFSYCSILLLTVRLILVYGHPQCLDYRAPFESREQLRFCHQYSAFGCCTKLKDSEIQEAFRNVKAKFPMRNRSRCKRLLKEVLCLECDPYAAHIFEAEGNNKFDIKKATPGLCNNFCIQFYNECSDVVNHFLISLNWTYRNYPTPQTPNVTQYRELKHTVSIVKSPAEYFCNKTRLKDIDYCYPSVKTIESRILARKYNKGKNQGCMCVEKVASRLRNPLAAVHSGDGTHRLFIAEQIGVIRVLLPNGRLLPRPFLDMSAKVLSTRSYADERGLLSIAFHPEYKMNGRFFVYYSTWLKGKNMTGINNHKTVLSEFSVSDDNPNRADRDTERIILEIPQPEENHNGGTILFGYDGMLYLTLGDGGAAGDPFGDYGNGLNMNTLLGSILRIDINTDDTNKPYKIPQDNPFIYYYQARPEIYAYGVRNMWRCSFDRGDNTTGQGRGRFFCGDVGQYDYEEIDLIVKGGNYGWRAYEGLSCYDDDLCSSYRLSNAIFPIHVYNHTVGKSILGGYVYRGCQNPNLNGFYIFADTWSSRFFTLMENRKTGQWDHREMCFGDEKYCTDKLTGNFEQFVLSFGEDEAGELYILATSKPTSRKPLGSVYRLVDPERRGDPSTCAFTPSMPVPPTRRTPRKPKCRDTLENYFYSATSNCVYYRRLGFCPLRYVRKYCKKTCGFCDSP